MLRKKSTPGGKKVRTQKGIKEGNGKNDKQNLRAIQKERRGACSGKGGAGNFLCQGEAESLGGGGQFLLGKGGEGKVTRV